MLLFLRDILKPRETEGNIPAVDTQQLEPNNADPDEEELSNPPVSDVDDETFNTETPDFQLPSTSQVAETDAFSEPSISSQPSNRQMGRTATPSDSVRATTYRKRRNVQTNESNVERELLKIETKKLALLERPEDEDMMFFRSLLPYFRKMHPIQKLRVRNKFQDVVIQELSMPSHGTEFSFLHSNSSSASTQASTYSAAPSAYSSQPISPSDIHCADSPPRESSAAQYFTGFYSG